jgi:hypothetical protein
VHHRCSFLEGRETPRRAEQPAPRPGGEFGTAAGGGQHFLALLAIELQQDGVGELQGHVEGAAVDHEAVRACIETYVTTDAVAVVARMHRRRVCQFHPQRRRGRQTELPERGGRRSEEDLAVERLHALPDHAVLEPQGEFGRVFVDRDGEIPADQTVIAGKDFGQLTQVAAAHERIAQHAERHHGDTAPEVQSERGFARLAQGIGQHALVVGHGHAAVRQPERGLVPSGPCEHLRRTRTELRRHLQQDGGHGGREVPLWRRPAERHRGLGPK